jgi:hypothetical protein
VSNLRLPTASRPWPTPPRFSLRAALVVTALFGVWFAHLVANARRQRSAVEVLGHVGVQYWYDYEVGENGWVLPDTQRRLPGPAWLRNLVGVDCVANVVSVGVSPGFVISDGTVGILGDLPAIREITGAHLNEIGFSLLGRVATLERLEVLVELHLRPDAWQHLRHLAALRKLTVGGDGIDDDNLAQIGRLRGLKSLSVVGAPITDAGLLGLGELKDLEELQLNQCGHIDDAGMKCLGTLSHLRSLSFVKSSVSGNAVDELWRQMPNLRAVYYSDGRSKTR